MLCRKKDARQVLDDNKALATDAHCHGIHHLTLPLDLLYTVRARADPLDLILDKALEGRGGGSFFSVLKAIRTNSSLLIKKTASLSSPLNFGVKILNS